MIFKKLKYFFLKKEVWLHIIFWSFFFASINVEWTENWIKTKFLPYSVAPHIALAVPILFFANVFWLIPQYLNREKWLVYLTFSCTLFFGFEVVRAFVFSEVLYDQTNFKNELFGDNSLVYGKLGVLISTTIFTSFLYRFSRDWIIHKSVIETLENQLKAYQLLSNNAPKVDIDKSKTTFSIKKRVGTFLLKIEDIIYFKAEGDFVFAVDKDQKKHIINKRLKDIYKQLDGDTFFQINRSEIVNFNFIEKYDSYIKNRLEIYLKHSKISLFTTNSRTPKFRIWVSDKN